MHYVSLCNMHFFLCSFLMYFLPCSLFLISSLLPNHLPLSVPSWTTTSFHRPPFLARISNMIFLMCSKFIGNGTLWMREKVPSSSIAERRMSYTPKEENTQGWVSTRSYSNSFGHTMFVRYNVI